MALIVQKYGGTSVGDLPRIRNVAQRVAKTRREGNDVVVVVSAMAGETDRLIRLAQQVSEMPDLREYDSLISTGEQVSAALLAITLQSMGIPARSFLGPQIRLLTDSAFSVARIREVAQSSDIQSENGSQQNQLGPAQRSGILVHRLCPDVGRDRHLSVLPGDFQ